MTGVELTSSEAGPRPAFGVFAALALALGAGVYVMLQPRAAGLPGALFLSAVAVTGLVVLAGRAMGRAARARRQLRRPGGLTLLDGTRDPLALTGEEGDLLYANRAYRGRFGGRTPGQVFSSDARQAADVYRLIRVGLEEGEGRMSLLLGGAQPCDVTVERLPGTGDVGRLLIWRVATRHRDQASKLIAAPESTDSEANALEAEIVQVAPQGIAAGRGESGSADLGALPVAARIVDEAPVGIVVVDSQGTIIEVNRTFRRLAGLLQCEGVSLRGLLSDTDSSELMRRLGAGTAEPSSLEIRLNVAGEEDRSATERTAQVFVSRLDGDPDRPLSLLYVVDTTEQKNLELQFAQSQKMQAVGQLAGGIAHDFNNTLQAIIGFCELLLTHHPAGDPSFPDIDQIRQNATRAAGLVRQLLAFSRQQTLMPKVIWLPDAIAENRMLLKRLLGEKVNLDIKHERDLGLVRVDETQLIQVLMNLAVNARDAMPDGGALTIRTANVSKAEATALGHELMPPADYVLIEVSDTGCGIPKELLGKIFEPFFTTKDVGQGTGLGLSTVYGIVKQTNGFIFPESEVGRGTTFRIYLPRHVEAAPQPQTEAALVQRAEDHTGRGTILLVEDEDAVRAFAARALTTRGYTVLEAPNGEAAIELLETHKDAVELIISDVIMPGVDGPTLVKTVRAERPDMKIILISGYAEDAFRKELSRDGAGLAFLPKPFVLKQLISKVKEVMAG